MKKKFNPKLAIVEIIQRRIDWSMVPNGTWAKYIGCGSTFIGRIWKHDNVVLLCQNEQKTCEYYQNHNGKYGFLYVRQVDSLINPLINNTITLLRDKPKNYIYKKHYRRKIVINLSN